MGSLAQKTKRRRHQPTLKPEKALTDLAIWRGDYHKVRPDRSCAPPSSRLPRPLGFVTQVGWSVDKISLFAP